MAIYFFSITTVQAGLYQSYRIRIYINHVPMVHNVPIKPGISQLITALFHSVIKSQQLQYCQQVVLCRVWVVISTLTITEADPGGAHPPLPSLPLPHKPKHPETWLVAGRTGYDTWPIVLCWVRTLFLLVTTKEIGLICENLYSHVTGNVRAVTIVSSFATL